MLRTISRDGTMIAYEKKGQGPPLILVLGALNKRGSGKKLAALLAEDFTVISYDRRGRGDSTDTLPYETRKEVEDIESLIDAVGGDAFLYGHSSGAILALLAANQLKAKIAGLALYEVPVSGDPEDLHASMVYRQQLSQLLSQDDRAAAVELFVKSVGVTDNQVAAMKGLPLWKGLTAMATTLAYDTSELMLQYLSIDAQAIVTPTIVMNGASSPSFMRDTALALSAVMPNATHQELDGQNHDVKAAVLAPLLRTFFSQQTRFRAK